MHVGFVTENIPNPATSGGALTGWMLVRHLLERKHDVTVVPLVQAGRRPEEVDGRVHALERLGATVRPISVPPALGRPPWALRRASRHLHPGLGDVFPGVHLGREVADAMNAARPDVILAYHWLGAGAVHRLPHPKMAVVGDPEVLADLVREAPQGALPRAWRAARDRVRLRTEPPRYRELLGHFEAVGHFANHHAGWLQSIGVRSCRYVRTPVPDAAGTAWSEARAKALAARGGGKPRVLHIGHLGGTSTLAGLDLLQRESLPFLERALGERGFELRLVGGLEPPPRLATLLDRPSVVRRGHVEPADLEFQSADAIVVPTPIELGIRVRILVAWSFGTPVVAHVANRKGIPELADGTNALLAGSGRDLAEALLRLLRDPTLAARIGEGGRRTYERHFHPDVAGASIEHTLRSILPAGEARQDQPRN